MYQPPNQSGQLPPNTTGQFPNPEGYQPNYQQQPGYLNQYPNQQPPMYQQPPKKKSKLPIILVVIAAICLIACGLCGTVMALASHGSNTGTLTTGSTPGATSQATAPTTQQHFKVGDTVAVGPNWKVAVNSVATNPGDGQYYTPKGVYMIVNVTLNNVSSSEQAVSSLDFTLKGPDGTKYDETFASGLNGVSSDPSGKVEPGGLAKGDIAYDVPTSVKSFTLAYSPSLFTSGQTIWDLTVS